MPDNDVITQYREMTFQSNSFSLKGYLHLPANPVQVPVVIGSHGLCSNAQSVKQLRLAEACVSQGMAYFRFDHRGCGESDGEFNEVTSLDGRCSDFVMAVKTVRALEEIGDRFGVIGSSLGGTTVLTTARQLSPHAIVTYAAPLSSKPIHQAYLREDHKPEGFAMEAGIARLNFDIFNQIDNIKNILIFHGDSDRIVPPSEAHRIYAKARMPKRLIMLRAGDHAMSLTENQEKFVRESVAWMKAALK